MSYNCPYCDRSFVNKRAQKSHQAQVHREWDTVELECCWCGESFEKRESEVGKLPTCGTDCMSAVQSWRRSGERHPNYKGGKTTRGDEWLTIANEVRHRDGECLSCGKSKTKSGRRLHVHHLTPEDGFEEGEDAHSFDNLVSLCFGCHKDLEDLPADEQLSRLGIESRSEIEISEERRRAVETMIERMNPQTRAPERRDDFLEVMEKID